MMVEVGVVDIKVLFDRTHEERVLASRLCWSDFGWDRHGRHVGLVLDAAFCVTRVILRTIQISLDTTCVYYSRTCIVYHMVRVICYMIRFISHTTRNLNW